MEENSIFEGIDIDNINVDINVNNVIIAFFKDVKEEEQSFVLEDLWDMMSDKQKEAFLYWVFIMSDDNKIAEDFLDNYYGVEP